MTAVIVREAFPFIRRIEPSYRKSLYSWLANYDSDCTRSGYLIDLSQFFERYPVSDLREIERHQIVEYKNHLIRKFAPATVARKIACLKSFFKWLVITEEIDRNPTEHVRGPRIPNIGVTPGLTDAQVRRLLRQPDRTTEVGARDYIMLLLYAMTGIRASELQWIQAKHFGQDQGFHYVAVWIKGGQLRRVPLRDAIIHEIKSWMKWSSRDFSNPESYLFINLSSNAEQSPEQPLSGQAIRNMIRRYCEPAGIDDVQVTPHVFRVTAASNAIEHGATESELLEAFHWQSAQMPIRYFRRRGLKHNALNRINY